MINRIFFISDNAFQTGESLPEKENIYFSVLVNPSVKGELDNAYSFIGNTELSSFAVTLDIREPLVAENIRFITSFLFLPFYLKIDEQLIINLSGNSQELLDETTSALATYFSSQGINNVVINQLTTRVDQHEAKSYYLFTSPNELENYYKEVLKNDSCYNTSIFFYTPSIAGINPPLSLLQAAEDELKQANPKLYVLISKNNLLAQEIRGLKRKLIYTETELGYQKQHNDILRSGHSTKELQDYYNSEYEVLPKWYKRLGHIIKVITGKRTFRSLFRGDVKKYNK